MSVKISFIMGIASILNRMMSAALDTAKPLQPIDIYLNLTLSQFERVFKLQFKWKKLCSRLLSSPCIKLTVLGEILTGWYPYLGTTTLQMNPSQFDNFLYSREQYLFRFNKGGCMVNAAEAWQLRHRWLGKGEMEEWSLHNPRLITWCGSPMVSQTCI